MDGRAIGIRIIGIVKRPEVVALAVFQDGIGDGIARLKGGRTKTFAQPAILRKRVIERDCGRSARHGNPLPSGKRTIPSMAFASSRIAARALRLPASATSEPFSANTACSTRDVSGIQIEDIERSRRRKPLPARPVDGVHSRVDHVACHRLRVVFMPCDIVRDIGRDARCEHRFR
jgi:hypothetical protein